MGLGETAEGAATALAVAILIGAALFTVVLCLVVRKVTGRRRPAFVTAGVCCALLALLFGAPLLSADSRAQRHAESERDDVVVSAGEELGDDGTLSVTTISLPCPAGRAGLPRPNGRDPEGWVATGFGKSSRPGVLDRFSAALRQAGYAVTVPPASLARPYGKARLSSRVLGTRNLASVLVTVYEDTPDQFFVEVEDGCLDPAVS